MCHLNSQQLNQTLWNGRLQLFVTYHLVVIERDVLMQVSQKGGHPFRTETPSNSN